ncbi:hypothetical protein [Buchnera aphidicola]|uniref:hypothetical protein n=1 Tax=Buchnera aphidicola TaxID=9 RepID=UPI002237E974|nr:hypothetical protein [Buchnera aphidicola]MCW5197437.1 hypothetical protein [Buchnera aphidicola (Chaitophorus viminalis)]
MIPDFYVNIKINSNNYNNVFYINNKVYENYNINKVLFQKQNINKIPNIFFQNKNQKNFKLTYEKKNFFINTKIYFKNQLYSKYDQLHSSVIQKPKNLNKKYDIKKNNNQDKYYLNSLQRKLLDICNLISNSSQDNLFIPEMSNIHWVSIENIIDPQSNAILLEDLQKDFNYLKKTNHLSINFDLDDLKNTHYKFNDVYIDSELDVVVVESLQKNFPDLKDRQLISNYSNHKILSEAVKTFLNLVPKFKNYPQINASTQYIIKKLSDGNIEFTLLYHSNLINPNASFSFPFKYFGIRAQCILSEDSIPIAQYSYFLQ